METDPKVLEPIYEKLPARFPPLYELLVLTYRWAEVDLEAYRLLANPPGPDLSGLFAKMMCDPGLWNALIPAGFIQFGRGRTSITIRFVSTSKPEPERAITESSKSITRRFCVITESRWSLKWPQVSRNWY
jgi:hypothetical protein